jgi:hypothetical protein
MVNVMIFDMCVHMKHIDGSHEDTLIAFIVLCATSYLACSINVELLFSVLLVCQITFFTEFFFCIVIWLYVYFQLFKPSKTSVSCMVVTTQTHH